MGALSDHSPACGSNISTESRGGPEKVIVPTPLLPATTTRPSGNIEEVWKTRAMASLPDCTVASFAASSSPDLLPGAYGMEMTASSAPEPQAEATRASNNELSLASLPIPGIDSGDQVSRRSCFSSRLRVRHSRSSHRRSWPK